LLMLPVIDGGLLPVAPQEAVANGSAAEVPLLLGTNRDESAFFAIGNAALSSLDDEGLRRWVRRLVPEGSSGGSNSSDGSNGSRGTLTAAPGGLADELSGELIARVKEARAARGEPVEPRDLWLAIATEYVFRLPSIALADAHAAAAGPGVGTYNYLFTWESPAFGGVLGSCHALEIPFVFGTVHNPAIQTFAGGGEDALALSALMRRSWTEFARTGSPGRWPGWDRDLRPTKVFGPWPGDGGLEHLADRPRDEELEAMAALVAARVAL
jgi:para-nitrobenzyl esterase